MLINILDWRISSVWLSQTPPGLVGAWEAHQVRILGKVLICLSSVNVTPMWDRNG